MMPQMSAPTMGMPQMLLLITPAGGSSRVMKEAWRVSGSNCKPQMRANSQHTPAVCDDHGCKSRVEQRQRDAAVACRASNVPYQTAEISTVASLQQLA
jgi:hypothetical protein